MKNFLFVASLFLLVSCGNNQSEEELSTDAITVSESADGKKKGDLPEIKFEEEEFDFGKITQGERVTHTFKFENTGKKNLIISGASGSCGCTVPTWPKEPIKPGGTGNMEVIFNSEGKSGYQEKTITVVTNCEPATRIIRIKADVIVAETAK